MSRGRTVSILLVDDDEVDRRAVMRSFQKHKIENPIMTARDGREALEILRGEGGDALERPYMILLDLRMPRMDGLEFLAELRGDPKLRDSIVFVLTTSDLEKDRTESYNYNVAGYILPGWEPVRDPLE